MLPLAGSLSRCPGARASISHTHLSHHLLPPRECSVYVARITAVGEGESSENSMIPLDVAVNFHLTSRGQGSPRACVSKEKAVEDICNGINTKSTENHPLFTWT